MYSVTELISEIEFVLEVSWVELLSLEESLFDETAVEASPLEANATAFLRFFSRFFSDVTRPVTTSSVLVTPTVDDEASVGVLRRGLTLSAPFSVSFFLFSLLEAAKGSILGFLRIAPALLSPSSESSTVCFEVEGWGSSSSLERFFPLPRRCPFRRAVSREDNVL